MIYGYSGWINHKFKLVLFLRSPPRRTQLNYYPAVVFFRTEVVFFHLNKDILQHSAESLQSPQLISFGILSSLISSDFSPSGGNFLQHVPLNSISKLKLSASSWHYMGIELFKCNVSEVNVSAKCNKMTNSHEIRWKRRKCNSIVVANSVCKTITSHSY